MNFFPIDLENWNRKEHFAFYMNQGKCSYSVTANMKVTSLLGRLRNKGVKFYPAFLYMVSTVVNSHPEFRTTFNDQGQLGYWDQMIPDYTIFHKDDKTFSTSWTEYSNDFSLFYKNYQHDQDEYGEKKGLWAKEDPPANTFSISSVPWMSFSSMDLNLYSGDYLLPIITAGKYFGAGKEIVLPVSIRFHHAVCDGYHASLFMDDLQKLSDSCEEWLM